MHKIVWAGLGLALLVATAPARAERPDLKLGLWETTYSGQGSQGSPLDLSNLPPEARARIEAYQKAHPSNPGREHVTRSCLTQDELDHELFKSKDDEDGCKRTVVKATKTVQDVAVQCPNGAHGEGHFEILSPTQSQGTFTMTGMGGSDGRTPFLIKSMLTSKWISADCGDVK